MKEKITGIFEKLNQFSFAQMTSNGNGKTSGSGTMGVLTIVVGCLSFLIGVLHFSMAKDATPDIMIYSTGVITIGAGLLGYRKSKDKIDIDLNESVTELEEGME